MVEKYAVQRWSHKKRQWLKIVKQEDITIVPEKRFAQHGHLVDKGMAGNGYHGRCSNCGLALVTDLGYNSWEGTRCIREEKVVDNSIFSDSWYKDVKYATKLSKDDAQKEFDRLLRKQGWGEFNFRIEKL
jgi:hypothetical protein